MRKRQFLLYFGFFAFLFCSCGEIQIEIGGGGSSNVNKPQNTPPRKFWAQNVATESFYQVDADLMAETRNCKVWVERGAGVSEATAASMAKAYEDVILPKMLKTYGINANIVYEGKVIANNTMEFADWLGDGDGKLCILLLDIKDGYSPGVNESYVGGYFWGGNFVNVKYTNSCDMIYIDINPSIPGTMDSNTTFAHEMQHMMNFVTSQLYREKLMDLWVDEGLSSTAEWLISGSHPEVRWAWYNQDPSGLIKTGNNFFIWGNREKESQYAVLDDYSTVYLFFQWLRLQAGTSDIYNDIIISRNFDYKAVTSTADKYMSGNNYSDWSILLKTWLAANYINAPSGPYGYRNDGTLKNIRARTMPAGIKNVSLSPGEGVYSATDNYAMPSGKQNIRYAALDKKGNTLSDFMTFSGGALLTYNMSTNPKGSAESGTTTGVASYGEAGMGASSRSVMEASFSKPFVIGAQDMLRLNGFEGNPFPELSGLKEGITVLE
jgi:hypothetical protein